MRARVEPFKPLFAHRIANSTSHYEPLEMLMFPFKRHNKKEDGKIVCPGQ